MTKKPMTVLVLALLASAVSGGGASAAVSVQAAGQAKILRGEILRDKTDLTAKRKALREERGGLLAQEKAALAKVKSSKGARAEKSAARKAVREKYARMLQDARRKSSFERKSLREDIASKKAQIQRLRRS